MLKKAKNFIETQKNKRNWRKRNVHNFTRMNRPFPLEVVTVGNYTYGPLNVFSYGGTSKLKIGHFCSIAGEVEFILNDDHYTHHLSTYPFKVMICGEKYEAISKGDIVVEDDVWIGQGAKILSGVRIGQGAIIAAGAIVTKNVPPYAIVGGVPAHLIKYRFDPDTIQKLLNIDYAKLDENIIRTHIEDLYHPLDVVESLNWLPSKESGHKT